jgi:hypothetical protein
MVQVPHLEPKDLYDRRVRRDFARLRAYNTLLEQIYHRVYATSQLSGNTSSLLYSVPPFILGLPKLDMEDCIVYLVWQLRQSGFEIRFTWPNLLMISWKHHEGAYLAHQNPIVQAMTPEPVPQMKFGGVGSAKKSQKPVQKGISFSQEIDIITNTKPEVKVINTQETSGVRRAAEYKPPASFVQTLERPGPDREQKTGARGNILADLWSV